MKNTLLTTLAALLCAGARATPPPEIPVADFFETSSISSLKFSPNGRYIVAIVPWEKRQNLVLIDLEKGSKTLLTHFKDARQAASPMWANDNRILFYVDDEGKESYSLYAVNPDGSQPTILSSGYSKQGTSEEVNSEFAGVLRRLKDDPDNILVLARISARDILDVARMNLKTGRMTVIVPAPGNARRYILDRDEHVRIAITSEGPRTQKIMYRDADKKDWTQIGEMVTDQPGWAPLGFDGDNRTLFVRSDIGRRTSAIYKYDTATGQMGEMVFGDDTYDADGIIYDDYKKKVVGISYEADRERFVWIDAEMQALADKMDKALPDTIHAPVQFSEDGERIVYYSRSDRDPGVYYLYERGQGKISELAVIKPGIDPEKMAATKAIEYKARDGLPIHAYLTLPNGIEPKNLPLVLHPHGGPFGIRDTWGYDPEVQFYANRGFAVMQVNYRGSGGYGDWFESAGHKKWGLEMQDDLTDAVKWAIAQGIADPKRIVISGASYGGYAVMAGLVYTPELYCAGINYVGVVNLPDLIPPAPPSSATRYWYDTRIGDLDKSEDRKRMRDTSPVYFADRIRVPLLMAYGKNDPRVKITHAYDIERALKANGRPYELIIEKDEGHGFRKEEKRIAFYAKIDAFLKKYVLGTWKEQ